MYFVHFLQIKIVGKLKSREIAWNQVFCVKNADFSPNHKRFLGKYAFYQTSDMKWNETTLKYLILTLISSLKRKRGNIQCKIWNCPLYPCFQCTVGGWLGGQLDIWGTRGSCNKESEILFIYWPLTYTIPEKNKKLLITRETMKWEI